MVNIASQAGSTVVDSCRPCCLNCSTSKRKVCSCGCCTILQSLPPARRLTRRKPKTGEEEVEHDIDSIIRGKQRDYLLHLPYPASRPLRAADENGRPWCCWWNLSVIHERYRQYALDIFDRSIQLAKAKLEMVRSYGA